MCAKTIAVATFCIGCASTHAQDAATAGNDDQECAKASESMSGSGGSGSADACASQAEAEASAVSGSYGYDSDFVAGLVPGLVADLAATYYASDGDSCGAYKVRQYPHSRNVNDEDFPLVAVTDAVTAQINQTAQLTGNVIIEQGNRLIVAPRAQIDHDTRIATFIDGVRVDQPGVIMQGASAEVDTSSNEAELHGVQFVLTDVSVRGGARQLLQDTQGTLTFNGTEFTRCAPNNNGWRLSTKSLVIEDGDVFGTARNAVLRLKSVPVFYSPYLKFPVSDARQSGFLFPNLSYSDEDGADISIPYYVNLAPNYDATLVPRYVGKRGSGLEAEFRHKSSWQDSVVSGAFLPKDDLYNGSLDKDDFDELGGEAVFGRFEPADRWLTAVDHVGRIGPFRTSIDYTAVSDPEYFHDLGSDLGVSSRVELERKGEIQYSTEVAALGNTLAAPGNLYVRLWAQRFQRLDEITRESYRRIPELNATYTSGLPGPFEFSLGGALSEFDRDTQQLNGLEAVTGRRLHVEPRVRMPLSWPFGFFSMTAGLRHTQYDLEQDPLAGGLQLTDEDPRRSVGLGSVDGGLFFERELNWFGEDLVQTLEPRVFYLYQEFSDQSELPRFDASNLTFGYSQLFRDNRFSGLDRIGDANQISAGVTTRFLSASSGREHFRWSLGEIFYFEDREVTLAGAPSQDDGHSTSALATEVSTRLWRNWSLRGSLVWDAHDKQTDESGVTLQYRRDNQHILNLGFRRRRDQDIEQTDISVYWPITQRYAIVGRWNYDLVSGRTIEGFAGIEYDNCCLKVRLMARRFLDSPSARNLAEAEADDGVFLQIVFKGLAGFGTKVESVLERGVRGYRSPEMRDYFNNRLN